MGKGRGELQNGVEVQAGVQNSQAQTSCARGSEQRLGCSTEDTLVKQGIGKENATQTSVRINNARRNTFDGSFPGIQDADYIAFATDGNNLGPPPY